MTAAGSGAGFADYSRDHHGNCFLVFLCVLILERGGGGGGPVVQSVVFCIVLKLVCFLTFVVFFCSELVSLFSTYKYPFDISCLFFLSFLKHIKHFVLFLSHSMVVSLLYAHTFYYSHLSMVRQGGGVNKIGIVCDNL